jgi:uncharacterized protein involved in exopolysaccharide biosynthesis
MSDPNLNACSAVTTPIPTASAFTSGEPLSSLPAPLVDHTTQQDGFNLRSFVQIISRRRSWFGITFGLVFAGMGLITLRDWVFSPEYQGGFRLLVQDPLAEDSQSSNRLDELARGDASVNTPNLIEVLTSPMLLQPLAEKLNLPRNELINKVSISLSRDTDVLNVFLRWRNPEQGKVLVEALSREYLDYSLRQRQEKLTQGLRFLDAQAPGLQQRVSDLQQELALFRRKYTMLAPEEQSRALEASREALAAELRTLSQTEAELLGMQAMVQAGQLASPLTPRATDGQADAGSGASAQVRKEVSPLVDQLVDVENDLASAQASFRNDSPLVQSLLARRNRLRPLLQRRELQAINSALQVNLQQQAKVEQQSEVLADQFRRNPELIKNYEALQQRLAVSRENLGSYLASRENFRLEVAQRTVPWQVIAPPSFGVIPVKPDLPRNLMVGLLLGVFAGAAAAYLRDRLDHVYHSPIEVEKDLGLPLLASIPYLPATEDQSIFQMVDELDSGMRFALRESLRNFYQALKRLRASKTLRALAITSTIPSEGKSTSTALHV